MFRAFKFQSHKSLLIVAAVFALAGFVRLFGPFDLALTALSDKIRTQSASGQVVVVGVDEYLKDEANSGAISDGAAHTIISTLLDAGADKIVLTEPVIRRNEQDTAALKDILTANHDRVFIADTRTENTSRASTNSYEFINSPTPVNAIKPVTYWGGVDYLRYSVERNGEWFHSAEAALTGQHGPLGDFYFIDYSIDARTIPFVEFLADSQDSVRSDVDGKLLVVGFENNSASKSWKILGLHGQFTLPTITALATETLNRSHPVYLGNYWAIILLLPFAWFLLGSRLIHLQIIALVSSIVMIFGLSVVLKNMAWTMHVGHGIAMILCIAPFAIYKSIKLISSEKSSVHPVSGLPALHQLSYSTKDPRPLIVANIVEFEELMGLLVPEERKNLSKRIAALATSDGKVWHGENGHFYWFLPHTPVEQLAAHLEGLNLILRNGFSAGNLPISLTGIFGVDLRSGTNMSDRIIGANVSAKRAAISNLNWLIYEAGDKSETEWTITRQRELDIAINAGQISAALQPKVDAKSGETIGFEALARWTHPQRGMIRPDEFIQAAEDGDCIKTLTVAVAHCAFKSFRYALEKNPNLTIAVNITPSLLAAPGFCSLISSLLAYHDLEPSHLILEITESNAFTNSDACVACMHELVALGVTLSIDDYGTGNSTLEYLRKIPAGELKIDRTFIGHLMSSKEDQTLIKSTIRLAQKMNMKVVAEGVEDRATLETLKSMGCDIVQGYLISRPLPHDQFIKYVDDHPENTGLLNTA